MRYSIGGADSLAGLEQGTEEEIAGFVTAAIGEDAETLKADWRAQIEAARLGPRLAKTVRSQVYPKGQPSIDAAALIWTKAPKIIDAYARGATIRPVNGARYLWIPTDDVPKKRQGNRLTPQEVEQRFGRDLVIIGAGNHRLRSTPSRVNNGVAYAGFSGLVTRRSSSRWRNASANQSTPGHRSYREWTRQFVLMFTLVPLVKVSKRLDLDALAREAEARFPGTLSKHWR